MRIFLVFLKTYWFLVFLSIGLLTNLIILFQQQKEIKSLNKLLYDINVKVSHLENDLEQSQNDTEELQDKIEDLEDKIHDLEIWN